MKEFFLFLLLMSSTYLSATTLNEFVPYNMYDTPREEIEDFYNFAVENDIPTAGITTLDQMHVLARGVKKLFRIYREEIGGHTFYHAFYTTRRHGLSRESDPYFRADVSREDRSSAARIVPWVDNLYELMNDEPEYGKIEDNPYPMIYQRLYLETGNGLKYLDEAEYFLSFNRPGPTTIGIQLGTLQPWSLEDEFGYWSVFYETNDASGMHGIMSHHEYHRAKRVYLDEDGENIGQIDIEASNPLIDSQRPFRYLILNAFDQNPASSYVEDTEDDLMEVDIAWNKNFYSKPSLSLERKIINGYAQNETLYSLNNRIKEISIYQGEIFTLVDKTMSYQFPTKNTGADLKVISVYRGRKYSDTCLAEYDLLIDGKTWLFGDNNE